MLFDVSHTNLMGFYPVIPSLSVIYIDFSSVRFAKPEDLCSFPKLTYLNVDNSQALSYLPDCLDQVPIQEISASQIGLVGTIPEVLCRMNLTFLGLSVNQLSGTLPACLARLTYLNVLHLPYNQLEGTLSPDFCGATRLVSLRLSVNRFNSTVPSCLYSLPSLISLRLDNNQFNGTLPDSLASSVLEEVRLDYNNLSGNLAVPSCRSLTSFSARNNNFSGALPWDIIRSPRISAIDLSFNNFDSLNGCWLSKPNPTSQLSSLSLAHNRIGDSSITLLSCLNLSSPALTSLDISGNQLVGEWTNTYQALFRDDSKVLQHLISLNVSHNRIGGTGFRLTSQKLQLVDLSFNQFSGAIMDWMFTLSSLREVRLIGNPDLRASSDPAFKSHDLVHASTTTSRALPSRYLTCQVLQGKGIELSVDDSYFGYTMCWCDPNRYWSAANLVCEVCPVELECSVSTVPSQAVHRVREGYFPIWTQDPSMPDTNNRVSTLLNPAWQSYNQLSPALRTSLASNVFFSAWRLQCQRARHCSLPLSLGNTSTSTATPTTASDFHCAEGRDENSLLCSRCRVNYFESEGRCYACEAYHSWLVAMVDGLVGVAVVGYLWRRNPMSPEATLSIGLFWLQVTGILKDSGLIASSSSSTSSSSSSSNSNTAVFDVIQTLSNFVPYAAECVFSFDLPNKFAFFLLAPWSLLAFTVCLFALVLCLFVLRHLCRSASPNRASFAGFSEFDTGAINQSESVKGVIQQALEGDWLPRVLHVISFLVWNMYMKTSQVILQMFNCEQQTLTNGGVTLTIRYLSAAPYIACDTALHTTLVVCASIALVVYIIGLPVFIFTQLYRHLDLVHNTETNLEVLRVSMSTDQLQRLQRFRAVCGMFYANVEATQYWWWFLAVGISRRLLFVAVLALSPRQSMLSLFLITLLLFLSLLLHVRHQPYRISYDNLFETLTLAHALLSFQFTLLTYSVSENSLASSLVSLSSAQLVQQILQYAGYGLLVVIVLFCLPPSIRARVYGVIEKCRRPTRSEEFDASPVRRVTEVGLAPVKQRGSVSL